MQNCVPHTRGLQASFPRYPLAFFPGERQAERYTKIVEELSQMRKKAEQLVRRAVGAGMCWSTIGQKETRR